jgi:menaquinone-dependent protoporphyrinogen IX oxidase
MWITKGPTDTKNVYEFTNWDDVDSFAKKIST